MVEFYLKLKLILRIISYLTYICWEIDNFVIKSDIFRQFFIFKNILKKLSCYHDNYFRYFMFGKYNGFVSKARVSACMYFLVYKYGNDLLWSDKKHATRVKRTFGTCAVHFIICGIQTSRRSRSATVL